MGTYSTLLYTSIQILQSCILHSFNLLWRYFTSYNLNCLNICFTDPFLQLFGKELKYFKDLVEGVHLFTKVN